MARNPDVLVLGAGLIGLATARELASHGLSVEILEERRAGAGASSAGAGLLSPVSDWESTAPFIGICRRARDDWKGWLDELVAESGVAVEYDASGALLVAFGDDDEKQLEQERGFADLAGESWRDFSVNEARRLVPDLSPRVRSIAHLPGEHRVDNVATVAALASACRRRDISLCELFSVRRIEVRDSSVVVESAKERREAAFAVLATGAWSATIAGVPPLSVRPVRGQMLRLEGADWLWGGSLRWRHEYVVRRGAAGLLVGATIEEAGFAAHPTAAGVAGLLRFSDTLFPTLAGARLDSIWAGLRPGSPDGRPLLGRIGGSPLFAACGHYRNGILLAPWTGNQVARAIAGGEAIKEAALFAPDRFVAAAG